MRDIFYDIHKLTLSVKTDILIDAFSVKDDWWVDELNCSKSFCRKKIQMSYDETMKMFNDSCHFVVIERRKILYNDYGEVGFSTLLSPSHFLWIILSVDKLNEIVLKYKLKPKQ